MKISTADMQKGKPMSDLISTQEAVVKIVDTAIQKIMSGEQKLTKEYEQSVKDAVNVILNTARYEIIQCKDCKYASPNGTYGCMLERFSPNDKSERLFSNDYCSLAERRTDGN